LLAGAGELLAGMPKAEGTRGQLKGKKTSGGSIVQPPENMPTLADLGIEKTAASRAQKIAALPEAAIRDYCARQKEAEDE
jgi:hypothetical protein